MLTFVVYFAPRGQCEQAATQHKNETNNARATLSSQTHSQTETKTTDDNPPNRNEAPECSLVIIGLITAFFICWQSYETRRSANALLASERAWIEAEITEHNIVGVKRYALIVKNKGKTPAKILRCEIHHGQTRDNAKLLKRNFKSFTIDAHTFIGGGENKPLKDDFNMEEIFTEESSQIVNAEGVPKGAFWVTLVYGVLVGNRTRKHTSSFVYLYDLTFSTIRRESKYDEYT